MEINVQVLTFDSLQALKADLKKTKPVQLFKNTTVAKTFKQVMLLMIHTIGENEKNIRKQTEKCEELRAIAKEEILKREEAENISKDLEKLFLKNKKKKKEIPDDQVCRLF